MTAFQDWPPPKDEPKLHRVLYTLPCLNKFIPGRSDLDKLRRSAIKKEVTTWKENGKKRTSRKVTGFDWKGEIRR